MVGQMYAQGLIRAVQALSMARTLDQVAYIVRHTARELVAADGATFVLRDGENCFYKDEDAISPLWKGQRFPLHACISGWSMLNRRATVIEDIYQDARIPHDAYRPTFVKSLVMVPIRALDPLGAIGTYWAHEYRATPEQVELLQALADSTSVAIENVQVYAELEQRVERRTAQLSSAKQRLEAEVRERQRAEAEVRKLSLTDELTGLYNRRGFQLLAETALDAAREASRGCLVVYVDLDNLKLTNDRYGHLAGDMMLVDAAGVLRTVFRDSDVVARLGGDEFAVLVSDAHAPDHVRQRIQAAVERFRQRTGRPLSLSVGLVDTNSYPDDSLQTLMAQADAAMYADKSARRAQRPVH